MLIFASPLASGSQPGCRGTLESILTHIKPARDATKYFQYQVRKGAVNKKRLRNPALGLSVQDLCLSTGGWWALISWLRGRP